MAKKRIAVLFGGASADHAASLHTAYSVLSSLPKEIEPLAIGITRAGRWLFYPGSYENIKDGSWEQDSDCCSCVISPDMTNKGVIKIISDGESTIHRIDAVFPVLHGKYGEDGRVQGLCKLAGLPVIGNDFAAAALCNDRRIMDLVLSDSNIKVIENVTLHRSEMNDMTAAIKKITGKLSFPIYTAPTSCSTSVGACRTENEKELEEAIKASFSHHPYIIAESAVKGRELTCAVLGAKHHDERVAIGELVRTDDSIDKLSEYIASTSELKVPAKLDGLTQNKIKQTARAAYDALSCKCFARVDMVLDNDGEVYVRRVRGIPGLDRQSIFTRLVTESAYSYEEMLRMLIGAVVDLD